VNGEKVDPPTTLPCPPWCAWPAGHGFDSIDPADGTLWRSHERIIRDISRSTGVYLSQTEKAETDQGPVLERTPVEITANGGECLNGPEARQLAAALLDAADAWDAAVTERSDG